MKNLILMLVCMCMYAGVQGQGKLLDADALYKEGVYESENSALGDADKAYSLNVAGVVWRNYRIELDKVVQCKNLQILNISNNNLSVLPKEFIGLKNLQILDLRDNSFTVFPKEILALKNLEELRLDKNKLTTLPKEIMELKKLKAITLTGNNLTDLPKEVKEWLVLKEKETKEWLMAKDKKSSARMEKELAEEQARRKKEDANKVSEKSEEVVKETVEEKRIRKIKSESNIVEINGKTFYFDASNVYDASLNKIGRRSNNSGIDFDNGKVKYGVNGMTTTKNGKDLYYHKSAISTVFYDKACKSPYLTQTSDSGDTKKYTVFKDKKEVGYYKVAFMAVKLKEIACLINYLGL